MSENAPRNRQQSKLFNAQNATGTLLLMSGSLALGLTAFWATPKASTGAAQSEVFATAPVASTPLASTPAATQTDASGWSDHEDNDDGEYDDTYRAAPQQDWRGNESAQTQPGFAQQPMSAPRGFTRGS